MPRQHLEQILTGKPQEGELKTEGFPADRKVYCPLVKGAGNTETTKYIALNALGVNEIGTNNVNKSGRPTYDQGGSGKPEGYAAYVQRREKIISQDPHQAAISAEELLKNSGFEELPGVIIRII